MTYAELHAGASSLAQRLTEAGIGAGDRVGVRISSGTADLYVAILGILICGAAYVPIDADDPDARAQELLGRAEACAVLGDQLRLTWRGAPVGELRPPTIEDDAWIIFTSGSTGAPKAVAVSHRAAAAFVDAEAQLFSIRTDDRVLAGLSVAFDASCEEMWLAWRNGATLVPAPRSVVRAGDELGGWLMQRRVSVVSTVPTLAAMWDESCLGEVRLLILGGEACPEALGWRLAAGREVWNTYGPTEATVVSTAAPVRVGEQITIGFAIAGWEVAVLDPDGEPVPLGEPGELVIGGVGLARYLDESLDAQRFAPVPALGWERAYRTGDIVIETPEGLRFVGRSDDQVKIGGRRIELGEIDAALSAAPGVKAALSAVRESAAGNRLLVGYVLGEVDPLEVRRWLRRRLPQSLVPQIVQLQEMPRGRSGKIDRNALPWPPPRDQVQLEVGEDELAGWLADRWTEQLGPVPISLDSDFFEIGGSSLAAAKLVSVLRERFPTVAVADLYNHRRLSELRDHLRELQGCSAAGADVCGSGSRRWIGAQLAALIGVIALGGPTWVIGTLVINRLFPGGIGPQVGWGWIAGGWLLFGTSPGQAMLVALGRRTLLARMRPGRYPRHGSLALRIWLIERLADIFALDTLAGTPWAARYARLIGHEVGQGARLGSIPSPTSLARIGEGATLEDDVDMHGWYIEGRHLIVGEVHVGAHARVGTRAMLMPGAHIGQGAEVEPAAVIEGEVPPGQRWAGSPARPVGRAGESWPQQAPPEARRSGLWKAAYAFGIFAYGLPALLAAAPGIVLLLLIAPWHPGASNLVLLALIWSAPSAAAFLLVYALLTALSFRLVSRLVRPGWHPAGGGVGWALWFSEALLASARDILFPLFSSIYTGPWLRLAGISVGRRAEVSTAVGLTALTKLGDLSFSADDVVFSGARSRGGWLQVTGIEIGEATFLGNGAVLDAGSRIGAQSLVGVQSTPPLSPPPETSWFGSPALELPRVPDRVDVRRTTEPPRSLIAARAAMELVRLLLPACVATVLGLLQFWGLEAAGRWFGVWAMPLAAAPLLLAGGVAATLFTVAVKWTVMGRYRAGEHPLWSFFVWRDEIVNSCQEQLAGSWLLEAALGTPLMSIYLRLMGSKVGRDVWCETLTITEFEQVTLRDGCALNRQSVVETHLFHDRLMRIGPVVVGEQATLGPASAMLPDSVLGDGCTVGGRSVVMRGERLPEGTRWHGAPVIAA